MMKDLMKRSCGIGSEKTFLLVSEKTPSVEEREIFSGVGKIVPLDFEDISLDLICDGIIDGIILDLNEDALIGAESRFSMEVFAQDSVPVICMIEREDADIVDRIRSLTDYGYIVKGSNAFAARHVIEMACKLFSMRKRLDEKELKLEELKSRQSAIIRSLRDKMIVTDDYGCLLEYYPSDGDAVDPLSMIGCHIGEFLDKRYLDGYRSACLKSVETGESQCFSYQRSIGDSDRLFEARVSSFEGDKFLFIIGDVTENKKMEDQLFLRTKELEKHRDAIIEGMAILAESRDGGTGGHIRRTREYVRILLDSMEEARFYPADEIDMICQCVVIHDIGKVGVPDGILLKPGRLTRREFEIVKRHPENGAKILKSIKNMLGDSPFFRHAVDIVRHHHERWDGSGYPDGLREKAIPFTARLMAVADVYDALVTERPYKRAWDHGEAVAAILEEKGTHFDPSVVDAFLNCSDEFRKIASSFRKESLLT